MWLKDGNIITATFRLYVGIIVIEDAPVLFRFTTPVISSYVVVLSLLRLHGNKEKASLMNAGEKKLFVIVSFLVSEREKFKYLASVSARWIRSIYEK